jgi:hypothetical protein
MPPKRKREEEKDVDSVFRPPAGTRTYETGQAVKEGLASGSRQGEYLFLDTDRQMGLMGSLCRFLSTDSYIQIQTSAINFGSNDHGHSALPRCIA